VLLNNEIFPFLRDGKDTFALSNMQVFRDTFRPGT